MFNFIFSSSNLNSILQYIQFYISVFGHNILHTFILYSRAKSLEWFEFSSLSYLLWQLFLLLPEPYFLKICFLLIWHQMKYILVNLSVSFFCLVCGVSREFLGFYRRSYFVSRRLPFLIYVLY